MAEQVRKIICSAAALLAAVSVLHAQENLEEITVSATRAPLTVHQSARMVTVLDTLQIRSAPVQSVNDLLKYAVGVDVRQRGAMGIQTDIGIRGGTFDQIAVLLNGVNISDPQTGHLVMDLPVDLSEIDRIEILEGPAGRVYGTSSLVGAIRLMKPRPRSRQAGANSSFSSNGTSGRIMPSMPTWAHRSQNRWVP